jgi:hypothetical protein
MVYLSFSGFSFLNAFLIPLALFLELFFLVLMLVGAEYHGGGANGDDGSVFDTYAVFIAQDFVHEERACQAGVVAQGVDDFALLVTLHVDDAVATIHADV